MVISAVAAKYDSEDFTSLRAFGLVLKFSGRAGTLLNILCRL